MAREFSKSFYRSKEWAQTRDYVLRRDKYLCVNCGNPAEEVHHIIHLEPNNIDDPHITMNPNNLKSLCRACHFEEHRGEHGTGREANQDYQYYFDENGMLIRKETPPV